ncbi:hypothetical protein C8J57DRAFT_1211948 [Mycena rebaudengoi]|nr:hypothetical protein C8J57DRAFT_1211948 [Mycena rebaudengoi]
MAIAHIDLPLSLAKKYRINVLARIPRRIWGAEPASRLPDFLRLLTLASNYAPAGACRDTQRGQRRGRRGLGSKYPTQAVRFVVVVVAGVWARGFWGWRQASQLTLLPIHHRQRSSVCPSLLHLFALLVRVNNNHFLQVEDSHLITFMNAASDRMRKGDQGSKIMVTPVSLEHNLNSVKKTIMQFKRDESPGGLNIPHCEVVA